MRTRSFGTITVGDLCVRPGYRMGQEYHHVDALNIKFGNSATDNNFNIPWHITDEGLFQATEPVIKAVAERFVRQNNLDQDRQIIYIDNLAYELSFLPAVMVGGIGRDIRPQLKPVSDEVGPELCGKSMMIWTKDLIPVTGHLVEISGYDLLLRDGAQLVAERSHFVSSIQGVTAVELDGLLSVQAFRIAE